MGLDKNKLSTKVQVLNKLHQLIHLPTVNKTGCYTHVILFVNSLELLLTDVSSFQLQGL